MSSFFSNSKNNNYVSSDAASDTTSLFSFKGPNSDLKSKSKKHWFSGSSSSSVSSKNKSSPLAPSPRSSEKKALHSEAIAMYMSYR